MKHSIDGGDTLRSIVSDTEDTVGSSQSRISSVSRDSSRSMSSRRESLTGRGEPLEIRSRGKAKALLPRSGVRAMGSSWEAVLVSALNRPRSQVVHGHVVAQVDR